MARNWPWTRKELPPAMATASEPTTAKVASDVYEGFAATANLMAMTANSGADTKAFDWMHYQAITGGGFGNMFGGEFNLIPTMRIMKGMYLQEPWINYCVTAIVKQFLNAKFVLKMRQTNDGQQQIIGRHPLLEYMRNAGSHVENSAYFTANSIADLVLTGNAYWWTAKDLSDRRRIPSERMEPVVINNVIDHYRVMDRANVALPGSASSLLTLTPDEVTHIRLSNPFSPHVGLSMIVATVLPVLIEKYGREYVIGFFLRGGQTSGVIETKTANIEQLTRLARAIMQAFGGRKNMHADKILPEGATWKGQGSSFRDIRLVEMLKENLSHFRAATGCTNTVLGLSENVNRATAFAEMEFFWKSTIFPLQGLFCAGVMASSLWKRFGLDGDWELAFDNSQVEYLDDFERKLEHDAKLAATWTINERRERMGKKPIERFSDQLESEVTSAGSAMGGGGLPGLNLNFALPASAAEAKAVDELPAPAAPIDAWESEEEKIQEPTKAAVSLFSKEFGAWEQIVLDNLDNRSLAIAKVYGRCDEFAKAFAGKATEPAMRAYDNQLKHAVKSMPAIVTKESAEDRKAKMDALKERARQVIEGKIFKNGKRSFEGFSQNAMNSIYDFIAAELADGKSLTDVAASVRMKFNESYGLDEAYSGQAETIVRTEFGAAVSIAQAQFGEDLASVTKRMEKVWVTMGDGHVRDSHADLDDVSIEDESDLVMDRTFDNGLRYPRESGGEAKEVINCRCTIRYRPISWE